MGKLLKLPIGVESFEKICREDFYYVDKTGLLEQLLDNWGEVNLFTRPRRFGKTLNMSMLKSFFEIGTDKSIFDKLYISHNEKLCKEYMGGYPVISISLKGVNAGSYEEAKSLLIDIVNNEAIRLQYLLESDKLTSIDKLRFERLVSENMSDKTLAGSMRALTELLKKHYNRSVIVLIDEYDVPLAKASDNGYYDEMVILIRNFLGNVLKTNSSLKFAVLTGCLRVAKESIFTGLNNFKVYSITDVDFDEYFGFTDEEVKQMLEYYGQSEHYEEVKEWYDGYRFGNTDVYCPWDVINYVDAHRNNETLPPQNYWLNTSGNDILNHFVDSMGESRKLTRMELEQLVNGEIVQKEINETLTYNELYDSVDNIWSVLFMTGYLTHRGMTGDKRYDLVIPNREIRNIITEHIITLFKEQVENDGDMMNEFCNALKNGEPDKVQRLFTEYMKKTVSVRDTFVRKPIKENFYHGMLLGILGYKGGWSVRSNRESGEGFSDIMIQIDGCDTGIIIEVKYTDKAENMETECRKALKQIVDKKYIDAFHFMDIHKVLKYGITCNIKKCVVMMCEENC